MLYVFFSLSLSLPFSLFLFLPLSLSSLSLSFYYSLPPCHFITLHVTWCPYLFLYVSLRLSLCLLCLSVSMCVSIYLSASFCVTLSLFSLFVFPSLPLPSLPLYSCLSPSRAPFPVLLLPLPFSASSVFSLSHLRPSWFSHVHLPDVFIFCLIFDPGTDEFNDIFFLSVYVSVFCAFKKFFSVLLYFSVYDTLNTHDERCLRNKFSRNMESCKWNIYLWKKKGASGGGRFVLYNGFLSLSRMRFLKLPWKKGRNFVKPILGQRSPGK